MASNFIYLGPVLTLVGLFLFGITTFKARRALEG